MSSMILPKRLEAGSTIGIFAPSEPILGSRIERFDRSMQILYNHGFHVKLAPHCMEHYFYMAGTVKNRIADIHTLAYDQEVDVMFAAWGGKSCNQLLPHLDYELLATARKPILGFSDVSVLLNAIAWKSHLITFHGPNVAGKLFETEHSDLSLLSVEDKVAMKRNLLGDVNKVSPVVLRGGVGVGRLFGGNLSTFVLGLLGTDFMPRWKDSILFFESGSQPPQIIDQYLTTLQNAGILRGLKGMIIGDFIREDPVEWKRRDSLDVILSIVEDYEFPVLYCPTFGHRPLENPILPIGAYCKLDASNAYLQLLEPVVR